MNPHLQTLVASNVLHLGRNGFEGNRYCTAYRWTGARGNSKRNPAHAAHSGGRPAAENIASERAVLMGYGANFKASFWLICKKFASSSKSPSKKLLFTFILIARSESCLILLLLIRILPGSKLVLYILWCLMGKILWEKRHEILEFTDKTSIQPV